VTERREELIASVNFLAKPFEMECLLQTIRAALDRAAP
jgi:FixJ family two-component response regulator